MSSFESQYYNQGKLNEYLKGSSLEILGEKDYLPNEKWHSNWDLGKKTRQDIEQRNRSRNSSPPTVLPAQKDPEAHQVVIEMGSAPSFHEPPKRSKNLDPMARIEEILREWIGSEMIRKHWPLMAAILAAVFFLILMIFLILIQY